MTEKKIRYVSPSLEWFEMPWSEDPTMDFIIDGVVHRLLDPTYYAWLHQKMSKAKAAFEADKFGNDAWCLLKMRFGHVQKWAIERYMEKSP